MIAFRPLALASLLVVMATAVAEDAPVKLEHPTRIANRLLLVPHQAAPGQAQAAAAAGLAALHAQVGAEVTGVFNAVGGITVVAAKNAAHAAELKVAYEASGLCRSVEYDQRVSIDIEPNDPSYTDGSLWGLHNTGQNGGTADADIDAPEAWNTRHDAGSVVVGVIDTGVNYTHEDLADNMWRNPNEIAGNGVDDDNNGFIDDVFGINAILDNGDPKDDNGHGSHCAGTIGAVGNNGKGIAGVAWNVQLMALKFLSAEGGGSIGDAIECINYGVAKGCHVLSNSWGGPGSPSSGLQTAVDAARAQGILFIAAAGNESNDNDRDPRSPANLSTLLDNVITVAALDRNDQLASFSNFGATQVQVGAPGVGITSCWYDSNTSYNTISGTSMACPHVAGVAALLRAQFPNDSYLDTIARIENNVDQIQALAGKSTTGGRVNLAKALNGGTQRPPPANDAFANAAPLSGIVARATGYNDGGTAESGEPAHGGGLAAANSVWWKWTATVSGAVRISTDGSGFDTVLGVYTGSAVNALANVASDDDSGTGTASEVAFAATANTTYYIAVDGKGATGSIALLVNQADGINAFDGAFTIAGSNIILATTNVGADKETGEPDHANRTGGASIWFRWTPARSGTYTISTVGSNGVDTVLAIYSGTSVSALTEIAANDDKNFNGFGDPDTFLFSELEATVSGGQEYRIAVDGFGGDTGDIILVITDGFNDTFASSDSLTLPSGGSEVYTIGANNVATAESGEPNHNPDTGETDANQSIWWSWTAPGAGAVSIDTAGSGFDTVLSVSTGSSVGALTRIAANDDNTSGGGRSSQVSFQSSAGTTYHIAVDGFGIAEKPFLQEGVVVLGLSYQGPNEALLGRSVSLRIGQSGGYPEVTVSRAGGGSATSGAAGSAVFTGLEKTLTNTFNFSLGLPSANH